MRYQEIRETLRKQPFEPFRVRLTTGQTYDIRQAEFAWPTRTSLFVGIFEHGLSADIPDLAIQCDLSHIVAIEPIRKRSSQASTGQRKPK